jgi:hypothetical protein
VLGTRVEEILGVGASPAQRQLVRSLKGPVPFLEHVTASEPIWPNRVYSADRQRLVSHTTPAGQDAAASPSVDPRHVALRCPVCDRREWVEGMYTRRCVRIRELEAEVNRPCTAPRRSVERIC